jgi:hypothetical protein
MIEWDPGGARSRDGRVVRFAVTLTWTCLLSICVLKFHFPVYPLMWFTGSFFLFLSLSVCQSPSSLFPTLPSCLSLPNEYTGIRRPFKMRVIWDFRREVGEICALLGYYAAYSGNSLPAFRANLSVPSLGLNKSIGLIFRSQAFIYWLLKMRPIGCPKTAVRNYDHTLRNIPEGCRSHSKCRCEIRQSARLIFCSRTLSLAKIV